jgi:hypothetical protein
MLYSIALEKDYPNAKDGAFMARDGSVLHRASRAFMAAAPISGFRAAQRRPYAYD